MRIHIVQKGETLAEIAAQYEVEQEAIEKMNPQIADPELIMPGMKLTIPQQSKKIAPSMESQKQSTKRKKTERKEQKDQADSIKSEPQMRRPMSEPLHDDVVHKKEHHVGKRMFHPASRPFSSIKHKQIIHKKSEKEIHGEAREKKQEVKQERGRMKQHIFCDCCQRPIYYE